MIPKPCPLSCLIRNIYKKVSGYIRIKKKSDAREEIMWLITPIGFFSIVQKPEDVERDTLTVRARIESDLDNLRNGPLPLLGPTMINTGTDYPYRAIAPKKDVAKALSELTLEMDYSNFKQEVANRQGNARAHLYGELWHVLHKLTYESVTFKTNSGPQNVAPSIPKAGSYGGVLVDRKGKVLLREVAGHFGGYVWTYAKGRPDASEEPHHTALREVQEETGYKAKIIGALPDLYGGTTVSTAFFIMQPVGQPEQFSNETNAVGWFTFDEAKKRIALTHTALGRDRDLRVLKDVKKWMQAQ